MARIVGGNPRPEDVDAIQRTIDALYRWISGPPGPRDPKGLEALFCRDGRLMTPHAPRTSVTPAQFTAAANEKLATAPFYETEGEAQLQAFGDIAHVWSVYDSRHDPKDPQPFARGVNTIQLLREDGQWKVLSMTWDVEREGWPLPRRMPA